MRLKMKMLSAVLTFILTFMMLLNGITAQAVERQTIIPKIDYVNAPTLEYTAGETVNFNLHAPNYGGRVQYRVLLWDNNKKQARDLWTTGDRYYTNWMPYGNNNFNLHWRIDEPGSYRITVYVKRAGVQNSDTAIKGYNCDSYMESKAFVVKAKAITFDKEGQTYGSIDANKVENYKNDINITAQNITFNNAKLDGNFTITGDNAVIRNANILGKLVVDPGKDGSCTLDNVTAKNIDVLSGGQNSIHIKDCNLGTMNVSSQSPVRIEVDGDTGIVSTMARGYVIFDRKSGTYGTITVTKDEKGETVVEFRGDIKDKVEVETAATIKTGQGSSIANLAVNTKNSTDVVKLEGQYNNVEITNKARIEVEANTKIGSIVANNDAEIRLDKTSSITNVEKKGNEVVIIGEGQVGSDTPPVNSDGDGSGSGSSSNGGGHTTPTETLADAKTTAHTVLVNALATYTESDYTPENWTTLTGFKTDGDTAIDVAIDTAGVTVAKTTAINGMDGVKTREEVDVVIVKGLIVQSTYTMTQVEAADENSVKTAIEAVIAGLKLNSVNITVIKDGYTEAIAGTDGTPAGANGSYTFTVRLSKGVTTDTTGTLTMMITATPQMAETVTIIGIAKFEETLAANITLTHSGIPAYQWNRGGVAIIGATESTYTLVEEDIGAVVTVTATVDGTVGTVTITSNPTAVIAKADAVAPSPPTQGNKTDTSVTLTANVLHQFSKDSGSTWQDSEVFTGLVPFTQYTFIARVKETATHNVSAASSGTSITTDKSLYSVTLGTITREVGDLDSTVTTDGTSVFEGNTVILTIIPKAGMKLKTGTLKANYNDGTPKEVMISRTGQYANTYTFEMPAYAVEITAEFVPLIYTNVNFTSVGGVSNGYASDSEYGSEDVPSIGVYFIGFTDKGFGFFEVYGMPGSSGAGVSGRDDSTPAYFLVTTKSDHIRFNITKFSVYNPNITAISLKIDGTNFGEYYSTSPLVKIASKEIQVNPNSWTTVDLGGFTGIQSLRIDFPDNTLLYFNQFYITETP